MLLDVSDPALFPHHQAQGELSPVSSSSSSHSPVALLRLPLP